MKLRVIVMNGQRIVECEENGEWKIQEVGKAGKLKPSIYDLYGSKHADKSKRHDGVIVHSGNNCIYQWEEGMIVDHSQCDFTETIPEIGANISIVYDIQGRAKVTITRKPY